MHGAVKHRANPRFWQCYHELPEDVRRLADESYRLLRRDPRHPSLHLKKSGRFWSVRIGLHYRALAVERENNVVWFWVGPHAVYNRLIATG
jgi:hypothetical protein